MRWANLAIAACSVLGSVAHHGHGTLASFTYTGPTGSRGYNVYTPSGYSKLFKVPLIIVLHGCTQSSSIIMVESEFNTLAEEKQFIVAYANQTAADGYRACWGYWNPADQSRGSGEPAIIAGIAQTIQHSSSWNIDQRRTYIAGFSAGAAMSVIVGITYSDIFAAIGVNSGLEYKSAATLEEMMALLSANGTAGPDPVRQGHVAYKAMGPYARRVPTIAFHGTADSTVNIKHGREVVVSMLVANSLADPTFKKADYDAPDTNVTGQVSNGHPYTIASWNDVYGNPVVQYFRVQGMNHAWSGGAMPNVDGADGFTDPKGPSSTRFSYDFFMANPMIGPLHRPTVLCNALTNEICFAQWHDTSPKLI